MTEEIWTASWRQPSKGPSVLIVYDHSCQDVRLELVKPEVFRYDEANKQIVVWNHFETVAPFIELVEHLQLKVETYAKLYKLIWQTAHEAVLGDTTSTALPEYIKLGVLKILKIVRKYLHDPALNSIFSLNLHQFLQTVWQFGLTFKKLELSSI